MELVAAGEDVRGQQSARAEHGAVGTAANRLAPGLDPRAPRRLVRRLGHRGSGIEELFHVVIALLDGDRHLCARLFGSQVVRQPAQELHVFFELLRVEVPDDEAQLRLRRRAGDLDRVNESFASFGRFRRALVPGQAFDDPGNELDRVHELLLRCARMHAVALDADAHVGGREVLVVDPADLRAVERVGKVRAERFDVEVVDASPDLLVDREADANRRVLDLRMCRQIGDGAHDLGDAGLVVGAEERRAVGGDDVVADPFGEDRVVGCAQHLARIARQHEVAAVVVPHHLRLHVGPRLV